MKPIITITLLLTLTGCSYQDLEGWVLTRANKLCNNDIHEVTVYFDNNVEVVCGDGVKHNYINRKEK